MRLFQLEGQLSTLYATWWRVADTNVFQIASENSIVPGTSYYSNVCEEAYLDPYGHPNKPGHTKKKEKKSGAVVESGPDVRMQICVDSNYSPSA